MRAERRAYPTRLHPTLELAADVGTPAVVLIVRARRTRSLAAALDGLAAADLPMLEPPIPLREAIAASYGADRGTCGDMTKL